MHDIREADREVYIIQKLPGDTAFRSPFSSWRLPFCQLEREILTMISFIYVAAP